MENVILTVDFFLLLFDIYLTLRRGMCCFASQ